MASGSLPGGMYDKLKLQLVLYCLYFVLNAIILLHRVTCSSTADTCIDMAVVASHYQSVFRDVGDNEMSIPPRQCRL